MQLWRTPVALIKNQATIEFWASQPLKHLLQAALLATARTDQG
jgi:hypothetical protein